MKFACLNWMISLVFSTFLRIFFNEKFGFRLFWFEMIISHNLYLYSVSTISCGSNLPTVRCPAISSLPTTTAWATARIGPSSGCRWKLWRANSLARRPTHGRLEYSCGSCVHWRDNRTRRSSTMRWSNSFGMDIDWRNPSIVQTSCKFEEIFKSFFSTNAISMVSPLYYIDSQ